MVLDDYGIEAEASDRPGLCGKPRGRYWPSLQSWRFSPRSSDFLKRLVPLAKPRSPPLSRYSLPASVRWSARLAQEAEGDRLVVS